MIGPIVERWKGNLSFLIGAIFWLSYAMTIVLMYHLTAFHDSLQPFNHSGPYVPSALTAALHKALYFPFLSLLSRGHTNFQGVDERLLALALFWNAVVWAVALLEVKQVLAGARR